MSKPKVHYVDTRLRNNAGMDFPACYAQAQLLDTDKGHLYTTTFREDVTCARCKRIAGIGAVKLY